MASSAPDHLPTPGLISNRPCYEGIKIANIKDIPELKTVLLESESGVGTYSVRGIGENPIGPVAQLLPMRWRMQ